MKKIFFAAALAALMVAGPSCKSKKDDKATETTTTAPEATPTPAAPVVVSTDDALTKGVADATKDVKGLTTRVDGGIIYLSGTISRDDNMRLTQTLNSLHPKNIDRKNLTVK